ncbi:hypothetical protein ACU635_34860 [[Actinomadura] parvosata]
MTSIVNGPAWPETVKAEVTAVFPVSLLSPVTGRSERRARRRRR